MAETAPILVWLRRDLRLADQPLLAAAAESGRPVIPVFVCDEAVSGLGAAPRWRLGLALDTFAAALEAIGSRLVLRRGRAVEVLERLIEETGARDLWWSRTYDPEGIARDTALKAALKARGLGARSFPGHLLFEPWEVSTQQGGPFRVYSPMWRAVAGRDPGALLPPVTSLRPPAAWPASDRLADWRLGAGMDRGAAVVARHVRVGEAAALARLDRFIESRVADYRTRRDLLAVEGTSKLSENLTWGEISPRRLWHAGQRARDAGAAGAEHFLKEVVWREFAWHLLYHTPRLAEANWRPEWDAFPWSSVQDAGVLRWQQGRTGIRLVDAAMRELYVTGTMHNRARMVVASYLTKHMLVHWRLGQRWFEECLVDWDPAANALGWQWVAGSGPDAAPYFRIFNPDTQAGKFDPDGAYRQRWLAEISAAPPASALAFFEACPRSWGLAPDDPYPAPLVALDRGRARALAAYAAMPKLGD